jgi:hypothetical protein
VPTQLSNAERHAGRRGWAVVARFKDDEYSAFKEVRRDDFVNLIGRSSGTKSTWSSSATWTG